jgi:hypothetical protein
MKRVAIGIVIGVAITLVIIYAPRFLIPVIETPETIETHVYIDGKIVVGGDGEPIELTDNPNATDPTYAELLAFLEADQTDKYSYIVGPPKAAYICADFARDVHNNAEAAGIRAAWVGIEIEGQTEGHALNAFETTDRGLVFIDCTGVGLWDETGDRTRWDRRAYVEVGQPYQVAYLDYYGHHHSRLEFLTYVADPGETEGQLGSLLIYFDDQTWNILEQMGWVYTEDYEARRQKILERLEWMEDHNAAELCMNWTMEWIAENEAKLYSWEFDGDSTNPIRIRADIVQGSLFEPPMSHGTIEERVIVINEVPVVWQITWSGIGWREPFRVWSGNELVSQGIVEDIHIDWGE